MSVLLELDQVPDALESKLPRKNLRSAMARLPLEVIQNAAAKSLQSDLRDLANLRARVATVATELALETECRDECSLHVGILRRLHAQISHRYTDNWLESMAQFEGFDVVVQTLHEITGSLRSGFTALDSLTRRNREEAFTEQFDQSSSALRILADQLDKQLDSIHELYCKKQSRDE